MSALCIDEKIKQDEINYTRSLQMKIEELEEKVWKYEQLNK